MDSSQIPPLNMLYALKPYLAFTVRALVRIITHVIVFATCLIQLHPQASTTEGSTEVPPLNRARYRLERGFT